MKLAILAITLGLVLLFGCVGQTNQTNTATTSSANTGLNAVSNQPNTAVDAKSEFIQMLNDSYSRFAGMNEYTIIYSKNILSTGEQKADAKYYRKGENFVYQEGDRVGDRFFIVNDTFYACRSGSNCVNDKYVPDPRKSENTYDGTMLMFLNIFTSQLQDYNVSSVDKMIGGMDSRCFILNFTSFNGRYCFSKSDKLMTEAAIPDIHFVLKDFEQSAPDSVFVPPFALTNSGSDAEANKYLKYADIGQNGNYKVTYDGNTEKTNVLYLKDHKIRLDSIMEKDISASTYLLNPIKVTQINNVIETNNFKGENQREVPNYVCISSGKSCPLNIVSASAMKINQIFSFDDCGYEGDISNYDVKQIASKKIMNEDVECFHVKLGNCLISLHGYPVDNIDRTICYNKEGIPYYIQGNLAVAAVMIDRTGGIRHMSFELTATEKTTAQDSDFIVPKTE